MKIATMITAAAMTFAFGAGVAVAQDKSAADKKAMMDDCVKQHDKMHDHAKEKGAGAMRSKCMDDAKAPKKPLHDHKKEHKQG